MVRPRCSRLSIADMLAPCPDPIDQPSRRSISPPAPTPWCCSSTCELYNCNQCREEDMKRYATIPPSNQNNSQEAVKYTPYYPSLVSRSASPEVAERVHERPATPPVRDREGPTRMRPRRPSISLPSSPTSRTDSRRYQSTPPGAVHVPAFRLTAVPSVSRRGPPPRSSPLIVPARSPIRDPLTRTRKSISRSSTPAEIRSTPALAAQWASVNTPPQPRHYSANKVIKHFNEYCHNSLRPLRLDQHSTLTCSSWDEAVRPDRRPLGIYIIKPFLYYYACLVQSAAHPSGLISKSTLEKFASDVLEVYDEARELVGGEELGEEIEDEVIEAVIDIEGRMDLPGKTTYRDRSITLSIRESQADGALKPEIQDAPDHTEAQGARVKRTFWANVAMRGKKG